jgi:elongation factor Ts
MSNINAKTVAELRNITGIGIADCKKALEATDGDLEKATDYLRKQGSLKAAKKADRSTSEGLIEAYIHSGKVGVLLKLACETDFVARTDDFKNLAKDIAMHIAAANPLYVSAENVPSDVLEREKDVYRAQLKTEGKIEEMVNKILEGKLQKFYEDNCLMEQVFIKDDTKKIKALIQESIAKMGENIVVAGFTRYSL